MRSEKTIRKELNNLENSQFNKITELKTKIYSLKMGFRRKE